MTHLVRGVIAVSPGIHDLNRTMIRTAPSVSSAPPFKTEPLAELLSVLNHGIRLEILQLLACGEQDVSTIADVLDLSVRAISHHLTPLRKAGLVRATRYKTRHIYALTQRIECSVEQHQITMAVHSGKGVSATLSVSRTDKVDTSLQDLTRLRRSAHAPF